MASDNVIDFPSRRSDPHAEDAADQRRRRRQVDLMRLNKLIDDIRTGPPQPRFLQSEADEAAAALKRWLDSARTGQPDLAARVKRQVEKLYRYIGVGPRTVMKVKPYLDVASAIAVEAGLDVQDIQIDVLRRTRFLRDVSPPSAGSVAMEQALHLAGMIDALAQRVIRSTGFAELAGRMRRVPGAWILDEGRFGPSAMAALFQPWYENIFEHWTEAPPLPGVGLLRIREREWEQPVCITGGGLHAMVTARIALHRDVRLCLGPATRSDDLRALFESRAHIEVALPEGTTLPGWAGRALPLRRPHTLEPDGGPGVVVVAAGTEYRLAPLPEVGAQTEEGAADRAGRAAWATTPLESDVCAVEHYYVSWTPVDPSHTAHWLDRDEGEIVPLLEALGGRADAAWYAKPSFARTVEEAIWSGGLEAALTEAVDWVRSAFEAHEAEWRRSAREASDSFIAAGRDDPRAGLSPTPRNPTS